MKNYDTICIQGGYEPKDTEPRTLPIVQSTTFVFDKPEDMAELFDLTRSGSFYSRIGNPTLDALEKKIVALDGGVGALATSSGMSATLMAVLNVCSAGDHIVSTSTVYGGTYNLFAVTLPKLGIFCTFVDPNAPSEEIEKAINDDTKLIFGETVANPANVVLDFDKFATISKKYGIMFMVDNTLATPVLCAPIDFGADVVVYSSTKYLEGHAGTIGGLVVDAGKFDFTGNERYPEFNEPDESYHGLVYSKDCGNLAYIIKLRVQLMRDMGMIMSPFTAYLTHLGMETLSLRMKKHGDNAKEIATVLGKSPLVEWIFYPTQEGSSEFERSQKYLNGNTGVIAFGVKGGRENAVKFIENLKLIKQVTHIADIRSCALHPASTTHRQLSEESLKNAGIPSNMIRLSVGCENVSDLLADIEQALVKM